MRLIPVAALLLFGVAVHAQTPPSGTPPATGTGSGIDALLSAAKKSGDDFLPPEQAFRFAALAEGSDRVRLNWEIADGYYLYRSRIKISTPSREVQLGAAQFPRGQVKNDQYFGSQEVYHHELIATVPVVRASGGALDLPLEDT
jgi:thiol:disulfide interchange protein DsbD